ncbi:isopentenyl-diphosphate Delta-isomerase [Tropicimonas sp. IMCC34043]|uniref:isopentenyl-diphosphate Delta-isomerase n=1 Tax=Tropicimonas sp. IMCC34043 TaxID=2248760 RepID=UPI000E2629DC|nr:isopentenyl-diphosphate Delta-isomerase [Tropicimonas sp. IMCC34043]
MTEYIPAWRDGKLAPEEKLAVHRLGLKHMAVSVFVLSGEAVLLQQRAAGKYHTPGLWTNTCCTHPRWNEAPEVCAIRRLDEELGITGLAPQFRQKVEYRAEVGAGLIEHEVVDIFVAEVADPASIVVNPDPDEVAAVRWMNLPELRAMTTRFPHRFTPWLRIYLDEHAEQIFGQHAGLV